MSYELIYEPNLNYMILLTKGGTPADQTNDGTQT